jgi:hypothetical protein
MGNEFWELETVSLTWCVFTALGWLFLKNTESEGVEEEGKSGSAVKPRLFVADMNVCL